MTDLPRHHHFNADPEGAQQSLAGLVLTVVELLRQLMERQAIRRVDEDNLPEEKVEEIGLTLLRLDEGMDELCEQFGLERSQLNLDLGPLGTLLPPN